MAASSLYAPSGPEDPSFFTSTFSVRVNLPARYLGPDLERNLENHLKEVYENSCFQEAYLRRNSLRLLRRSLGQTFGSHFNGDMTFRAIVEAQCFKPINGALMRAQVVGKNAIGLQTRLYPHEIPMEILITRNQNSERLNLLNQIAIDQIIVVKLLRYEFRNNKINAVGLLHDVLGDKDLRQQHRWALTARPVPLVLDERLLVPLFAEQVDWWERQPEITVNKERLERLQQWREQAVSAEILQGATSTWWLFPDLQRTVTSASLPALWEGWPERRSIFTFTPEALSAHYFPLMEIFRAYPGEFFSPLDTQRRFLVVESRPPLGARGALTDAEAAFGGSLQALLTARLAGGSVDFQDQVTAIALTEGPLPSTVTAAQWEPFQTRDWSQRPSQGGINVNTSVVPALLDLAMVKTPYREDLLLFDSAELLGSQGAQSGPSVVATQLFYLAMQRQNLGGHLLWNLGTVGTLVGSTFLVGLATLLSTLYRSVDFYRPQFGGADGNIWLVARNYHGLLRESPTATSLESDDRKLWEQGLKFFQDSLTTFISSASGPLVVQQLFSSELLLRSELWTTVGRAAQALMEQSLHYWETIIDYTNSRRRFDAAELVSQQRLTLLAWAEKYFPPVMDEKNQAIPQYQ